MEPGIIAGGSFTDARGKLSFVNDFTFNRVKRFYQINNVDTNMVRAWQGHKVEHKYFYAATGSFVIGWVKIDDWEQPSPGLKAGHTILSAGNPSVLSIPPGYANGIRSLETNASLIIFSDLTMEESANDRWTFESNLWLNWQQFKI